MTHSWRRIRYLFLDRSGLRAAWGILLFVVTTISILYLLMLMLPVRESRDHYLSLAAHLANEGELLVAVLGSTAVMAIIEQRSVWSYGLRDPHSYRRFLGGVSSALVLTSAIVGCLIAMGRLAIEGRLLYGQNVVIYGMGWAATFIMVALAEEAFFYGYLQTALTRLVGFWKAAVLLSLAFGLLHVTNKGERDWLGIADLILAGLVSALCLRLSGSLWWGIGFHAGWDWTAAFLYGRPGAGYVLEGRLLESNIIGNPLWSGSTSGTDENLLTLPVLGIAAVIVALTFRRPLAKLLVG